MRVVIDTNQLIRMAAAGDRSPLLIAWRERRFELVMSAETLADLETVLARPKTQRFVPAGRGRGPFVIK